MLSATFLLGLAFNVQGVKASGSIYIKIDGSVDPQDAPISSVDNIVYTFNDDIYDFIVVERDNIVIDGAGFTLQGNGTGRGVDLTDRSNVTVQNMKIKAFELGIWLFQSSDNKVLRNTITNNTYGVWIFAVGNTLSDNIITHNSDSGVVIDINSSNNTISGNNITNNNRGVWLILAFDNKFYHNNFIDNTQHVHILVSMYANVWNNAYPSGGNYWSAFGGMDVRSGAYQNVTGSDGICDTLYIIDGYNQDNYPLIGWFSDFSVTSEDHVQTICNSTISDLWHGKDFVRFTVAGPDGTIGFCRIMIPRTLMKGPFTVYVDENVANANEMPDSNTTHALLYFNYVHSTHMVTIVTWTERYQMLLEDLQNLNSTLYALLGNITDLQEKNDSLLVAINLMQEQIDSLNSTDEDLQESIENLQERINLLNSTLQTSISGLQEQYNSMNATVTSGQEALINELVTTRNLIYVLIATVVILIATTVYSVIRKPKIRLQTQ